MLAYYDGEKLWIDHDMPLQSLVLAVAGDLVITPEFSSGIIGHPVSGNSRAELLVGADGPKVTLHMPGQYRILNLLTGIYRHIIGAVAGAFSRRGVCVRRGDKLLPLISMSTSTT